MASRSILALPRGYRGISKVRRRQGFDATSLHDLLTANIPRLAVCETASMNREPMGDQDHPCEIIISIQDKPYEMILSGRKTYEFRKRWKLPSARAYVYRSGKTRELRALMELGRPQYGTPSEMEALAESMLPGNGLGVKEYLEPTNGGYAIPILSFTEFPPISLSELRELGVSPPQYYTYVDKHPRLKSVLGQKLANTQHLVPNYHVKSE